MNNPFSDFTEVGFEQLRDTGKKIKQDLVKGVPAAIKQQLTQKPMGNQGSLGDQGSGGDEGVGGMEKNAKQKPPGTKIDPVTGKPIPSKKMLTHLSDAAAKVRLQKLQQVRKQLEEQRLKITEEGAKKDMLVGTAPGQGPAMKVETKPKLKDDAVAKTLRKSQSTGETRMGAE